MKKLKLQSFISFMTIGALLIFTESCKNEDEIDNTTPTLSTVSIPAGTFTMGSSPSNENYDETQHTVTLSAFRMSKYEITNLQYAAFLNAKGISSNGLNVKGSSAEPIIYSNSSFGLIYSGSKWVPVAGYENAPVTNVTWYGAFDYASYVGGALPTEAQWEYACRAGTNTLFNTGNSLNLQQANFMLDPYVVNTNKIKTIGTYPANAWGLYDMHGNVSEWCADYEGTYPTSAQNNPTGPASGFYRVFRGGSYTDEAKFCRSAFRYSKNPDGASDETGFRVVFLP